LIQIKAHSLAEPYLHFTQRRRKPVMHEMIVPGAAMVATFGTLIALLIGFRKWLANSRADDR
jgi:hypothetical protein